MKNYQRIPLYEPFIGKKEKIYVNECLDTNWISSRGKYVPLFENSFKKFIQTKYAISVSNGTVALHLALLALGIKKGDEVIVPTFTYIASVNAIKYVDANVQFIDSKLSTWQIDETLLEKKINSKTKAIIVPHIYGQSCEMKIIKDICKKKKIFLIEDCAEAFGTYYKKKHVGTFGDIATFSFFGSKTITTGEGGMVLTNNPKIAEKVDRLKMVGVVKNKYYWHNMIGYNYRMTNICAAIGYAQLSRAKDILKKKRNVFKIYKKKLSNLPLLLHEELTGTTHSYWVVSIRINNLNLRDKLRKYLDRFNIETRPTFYPIHTMPMYYKKSYKGKFKNAIILGRGGIILPSGPLLSSKQIEKVCIKIRNFFIQ